MAPYFVFHRKKVAWQMPSLRKTSSTGNPDSDCLNVKVICSCEKLLLLMALTLFVKTKSYYFQGQDQKLLPLEEEI
jgi:hypothetical protein